MGHSITTKTYDLFYVCLKNKENQYFKCDDKKFDNAIDACAHLKEVREKIESGDFFKSLTKEECYKIAKTIKVISQTCTQTTILSDYKEVNYL